LHNGDRILILESRAELFGLLLKLVNRNLSNKHREIFSGCLTTASCVAHGNVSLISEAELFIISDVVDISRVILLDRVLPRTLSIFTLSVTCFFDWFNFGSQMFMLSEKLIGIDTSYNINWDVRSLVLEATMDIYIGIYTPAGVTETLEGIKFIPL